MDNETNPSDHNEARWAKYGPFIFLGTIVGLPAMNLTAAIFNYKSLKLQIELERMKKFENIKQ